MQFIQRARYRRLFLLILGVISAGCGVFSASENPRTQGTLPGVNPPMVTLPAPSATRAPSLPPTDSPTLPLPPPTTYTPPPTHHPMNILAMRQTPYPGSEIIIEEMLEPGANYNRYIASYQSEGLKIYALLTIPYGAMPPTGWPAIVFNHGYIPPTQYRTTERYVAYVDWLGSRGSIFFPIDFPRHDRPASGG